MIILFTVIIGLGIFTLQIILRETQNLIAEIIAGIPNLNQTQKPVEVGKINRTIWVKAAPLYHVISK